jgi:hypothetical protein
MMQSLWTSPWMLSAAAFTLTTGIVGVSAQVAPPKPPPDAVDQAQRPREVPRTRPEQMKGEQDRPEKFDPMNAKPVSPDLKGQPKEGKITGFDFSPDPLNADKPFQTFEEIFANESAARPGVMAKQRAPLESRYDLNPRLDPVVKMSRGKPLAVGPTARLRDGMTFDRLDDLSPAAIKERNLFPYPALPHPLHVNGGQVFPKVQLENTVEFFNLVLQTKLSAQEKKDLVAFRRQL